MTVQTQDRKLLQQKPTPSPLALSPLTAVSFSTSSSPPPPPPEPLKSEAEEQNFSSTMAPTIFALVAALIFFGIFSVYLRCFADRHHGRRDPQRKSAALSLPVCSYGDQEKKFQVDCAICLAEFEDGERVKTIPSCKHVFHPDCIDKWLSSHASCPVCRSTRFSDSKAVLTVDGGCSGGGDYGGDPGSSDSGGRSTARNDTTCLQVGSIVVVS